MTRAERDAVLAATPTDDVDAGLRVLLAQLEAHGELDRALCVELAHLTGDAAALWERLIAARAAWRRERGLPPSPMPFMLGE